MIKYRAGGVLLHHTLVEHGNAADIYIIVAFRAGEPTPWVVSSYRDG